MKQRLGLNFSIYIHMIYNQRVYIYLIYTALLFLYIDTLICV